MLGRFANGKPAIFHGATEQASAVELATLSEAVREEIPPAAGDLLAHGDFPRWDVALTYLGERPSVPSSELGRLRRQVEALPNRADDLRLLVFGREEVEPMDALTFTAHDLYAQ